MMAAMHPAEDRMAACRLVIADDHPLFRDALRLTIGQTLGEVEIAEADSFDSLQARLEAVPETDLVLLDLKSVASRVASTPVTQIRKNPPSSGGPLHS